MNNELGRDGRLCWHIREDLKRFKTVTTGGCVIMGRKTWDSLPKRPLPGRFNIVISRTLPEGPIEGKTDTLAVSSLGKALEEAGRLYETDKIFITGGESVYRAALPLARKLDLTRILAADSKADTFFPEIDPERWVKTDESEILTGEEGLQYRHEIYESRNPQQE